MRLGIVYHMPFWRAADGTLRELEGSFARYVDSLAPYFDEISLCVPTLEKPSGEGTAIRASNVTIASMPSFEGPAQFYPKLPVILPKLAGWVSGVDVLHCRVPTPAAAFAFGFARMMGKPAFILIVGDLRALLPTMPYRGLKKIVWRGYTEFEERAMQWMADHSLAFANGGALADKHSRPNHPVIQTTTTTISASDIATRTDTCLAQPVRILTVSRIDPRKGLRVLPEAIAGLVARGIDATIDIVGPSIGRPGDEEKAAIAADAAARHVESRVNVVGPVPLDQLLPLYRQYDVFVLPTLPGEGIPRVLLESMTSGVPVVTTRVSGIPSLITHEVNGLLVDDNGGNAVADAVARVVTDAPLRRRLIANGYETARGRTLEAQAAKMMAVVSEQLGLKKVCFVLPSLAGGGAERVAVQVLSALDERRWDRSMYLFRREGPYLDDLPATVRLSSAKSESRIGRILELRRYIRETRPDLVVSFLSYFTVLAAAKMAGVGARVVFVVGTPMSAFLNDADYHWKTTSHRTLFSLITRAGYNLADAIATTSKGVSDDLMQHFGVRDGAIRVVHNPIDFAAMKTAVAEPLDAPDEHAWKHPAIVSAGRLAEAKNYPLLIEAMALLRRRLPAARLFILGQGEQEPQLRQQIASLGLSDVVRLCGFQRNPWKYIARADVFALTSHYEGFGNVLVEAMACGVPVVVTSSPGPLEIVRDNVDGVIVPEHTPSAVAQALESLLTDDRRRASMGAAAKEASARFALPAIAGQYDSWFSELVA
jgi:glycosyltransferase involved in cell wall biosynthesis